MSKWHIGEVLIQKKLIDWEQLGEALDEQKRTHELIGEVLVRKSYIPRHLLFKALAERHAVPFVDISHIFIDPGAVQRIPKSIAEKYSIMPIELQGDTLVIGISDPVQIIPTSEIAALAKVSAVKSVLCTPDAVKASIEAHYNSSKDGVPQ